MDVREAIESRRAYRSLEESVITEATARDLARHAALAPSCFNKQPWRYVFVYGREALERLHGALAKGNEWARAASMIAAVYSRKDLDCDVKGREYYLFDLGLSTAFLVLRATELGLVAHPIAGFDEKKAKEILGIGAEMKLITLVIVGRHAAGINDLLTEQQAEAEAERPERLPMDEIARFVG
ncbi:MAG TPA: nitroreductase [Candidatus Eisenbacteria bacterium]|uniref:Nitroreductase n=1 Tax=Eiseniibacteriota bacterium TaxID=2212470 RepID=A0A7V2AUE6_UNCEI|nr:nitroreductase [Candidatus Eisenbacteria bacterium]